MGDLSINGPRHVVEFMIGTKEYWISETVVNGCIVTVLLCIFAIVMGSGLKERPTTRKQALAEFLVSFMNGMIDDNIGFGNTKGKPEYSVKHNGNRANFAPYITGLFLFIFVGAMVSWVGLRSVPMDICITGTWAAMTLTLIFVMSLRVNGPGGHVKKLATPFFMLPMNILGDFTTPMAMAIRLFGNMTSGTIIGMLIYAALAGTPTFTIGSGVHPVEFHITQLGTPALTSMYFDLFAGFIQSYVFIMLTMANVKRAWND